MPYEIMLHQIEQSLAVAELLQDLPAYEADDLLAKMILETAHDPSSLVYQTPIVELTPQQQHLLFQFGKDMRRHGKHACKCMSPGCAERAISSHTIQRSFLSQVRGAQKHLRRIQVDAQGTKFIAQNEGPAVASTFLGFCPTHDTEIFRPIETGHYENSSSQNMAAAYRSIARELREKLIGIRACSAMLRRLYDHHQDMGTAFVMMSADFAHKIVYQISSARPLLRLKRRFEQAFDSGESLLDTVAIYCQGQCTLASWGLATPEIDAIGTPIEKTDFDKASVIFISTHKGADGFAYSFSSMKEDRNLPFPQSLFQANPIDIAKMLPSLLIGHCELSFFSDIHWDNIAHIFNSAQRYVDVFRRPTGTAATRIDLGFVVDRIDVTLADDV